MSYQNGKPTEVKPRTSRRNFTVEYKRRILAEADQCGYGKLGALLRREGLYHSHLKAWRMERELGTLGQKRRGPRADPNREEVQRLSRENVSLKRKLEQAEAIIEAQKKLARLLDNRNEE